MALIWTILYLAAFLFLILLAARLVLSWVESFSPDWRPRGPMLVVAEVIYTVTDPALKAVGRVIPPVRIGSISFDVAFLLVMIVTWLLYNFFGRQLALAG